MIRSLVLPSLRSENMHRLTRVAVFAFLAGIGIAVGLFVDSDIFLRTRHVAGSQMAGHECFAGFVADIRAHSGWAPYARRDSPLGYGSRHFERLRLRVDRLRHYPGNENEARFKDTKQETRGDRLIWREIRRKTRGRPTRFRCCTAAGIPRRLSANSRG